MIVKTYVKKPVKVEAVLLHNNIESVTNALLFMRQKNTIVDVHNAIMEDGLTISTLEGNMLASWGDYIIKGIDGEFYPCKPDIFHRTYDSYEEN